MNSETRSNRTIVGLKLRLCVVRLIAIFVQQSHHCGIETLVKFGLLIGQRAQQSHHCGIETTLTLQMTRLSENAAIAPLWD